MRIYYYNTQYKVELHPNLFQNFDSLEAIFKAFPETLFEFDKQTFLTAFENVDFEDEYTADEIHYVYLNEKLGIKNENNELLIPPLFDQITYYPTEELYVMLEAKYDFVINSDWQCVIAPTLDVITIL